MLNLFLIHRSVEEVKPEPPQENPNPEPQTPRWVTLVLSLLILIVLYGIYNVITTVEGGNQVNSDKVEVTSNAEGYTFSADSLYWRKILEEIEKIFKDQKDEIDVLIRKAENSQTLSLSEVTRLLAWLESNRESLSDRLKNLYMLLQGKKSTALLEIKKYISDCKKNPQIYKLQFCFEESWLIEHYNQTNSHYLDYLISVTITSVDVTKDFKLNSEYFDQTMCLDAVAFMNTGKWVVQFDKNSVLEEIPPNDLLEYFWEEDLKVFRPEFN